MVVLDSRNAFNNDRAKDAFKANYLKRRRRAAQSFTSTIYNCGVGMNSARTQLLAAPKCGLSCTTFWKALTKCKELMNATKIIAEKGESLAIVQRRLPFVTRFKVLTTAARLGQVADAMDRLIGGGRGATTYTRSAASPSTDAEAQERAGRDALDEDGNSDRRSPSDSPDAGSRRGERGR